MARKATNFKLAIVKKWGFSGARGIPNFDFGERVRCKRQRNGKYTVWKDGYEPEASITVVDVPKEKLEFL